MATALPPRLTELLAETRWIRALARRLVADPDAAEDLAQEACLTAIDRPPAHDANLRAWMHRVLQNLVRQRSRAAKRRVAREQLVVQQAAPEHADPSDLAVRAAMQRAVVDAVLALEQPFRDTILLRYFEDMPPRTIAVRMQVPVATVNSRLLRATAQLRQRLDRGASTRAWRLALLPLPLPLPLPLTTLGVLLMNTKALTAVAVVLIGTASLWLALRDDPPTLPTSATPVSSKPENAPEQGSARSEPAATNERSVVPANATTGKSPEARRTVHGRVIDTDGQGIPGLHVRLADVQQGSDDAGRFELQTTQMGSELVRADEPGWNTVLCGAVRAGATPPPMLVVAAPTLQLAGDVRADHGEAIVGASIQVLWPDDLRSRLADISDNSREVTISGDSRANGAFAITAAKVRGAELMVSAAGFAPERRALPERDDAQLHIVLQRPVAKAGMVQGMVVDPRGRPMADAYVGLGVHTTRSDAAGNFLLDDDGKGAAVTATLPGHRRGTVPRADTGFAPFVMLTLGGEPLTLSGQVVDQAGQGLADVLVWVTDVTPLCASREPFAIEGVAAGCPTSNELRAKFERGEFAGKSPRDVLDQTATAEWSWVRSDASGAFTVKGLEDRAYRVRALDRETLLMVELGDVLAGRRDVRLVLDQRSVLPEISGVVVAQDGTPIPGVSVAVQIDAQRTQNTTMHEQAVARATTNEAGEFNLRRVPKQLVYLRLEGDRILPAEPGRGVDGGLLALSGGRADGLRLVVSQRMHVQVELLDATSADSLVVLDANDRPLPINVFLGGSRRTEDCLGLTDGKSAVFVVPEAATTLVLRKGETVVRRETLQLRGGDVNRLRF